MALTPDKNTIIEKIRKLINLAASTNQREAERAAFKACALIRDHNLDVCDPDVIDGIYQSQAQLEDQVRRLEAGKVDDDYWGAPQMNPNPATYGYVHTSTHTPGYRAPVYSPAYSAPPSPPPMSAPVNLKGGAKFDSNCLQCGGRIKTGDPVLWQKAKGTWHANTDCYQKWVNQQATAAFDPFAAP